NKLAEIVKPGRIVEATVEFVDLAGLVEGASKGEGLGNKFLSHIRECDAIANVLRHFDDGNVVHVAGRVSPIDDLQVIMLELILADLQTVEKAVLRFEKAAKSGSKEDKNNWEIVLKVKSLLEEEKVLSDEEWTEEEMIVLKSLHLMTMKPMINVLNVAEDDASKVSLGEEIGLKGKTVVLSAKIESELADLSDEEAKEYLVSLNLRESGLTRLVAAGYELLGLISYFTAGEMEVKAWTITKGMRAPQAAGVIHTDFEANFIKADVVNWEKFVECGGWEGCREKGLARMEGKDYVMNDGDVVFFRIGK
ncbi:MAG TPA: redox-regulated ATPase YchF, partial [bacterium]|nr:redox-regulated ATPase YchF [bacterium]